MSNVVCILLTCHLSIYLFRAVCVYDHQNNIIKSGRWTFLQSNNKTGLLEVIIFYTGNKPQWFFFFFFLIGFNWCLQKLYFNHCKLQREIVASLGKLQRILWGREFMCGGYPKLSAIYKASSVRLPNFVTSYYKQIYTKNRCYCKD